MADRTGKELLLATDLEIEAELIALIYRYRWQIELFFKWMKNILGNRHLMAESPAGAAIQTCSALIAALMLLIAHWQTPHQAGDGVDPFLSDGPRGVRGSHNLVRPRKNRVRFSEGLPPRRSLGRRVP